MKKMTKYAIIFASMATLIFGSAACANNPAPAQETSVPASSVNSTESSVQESGAASEVSTESSVVSEVSETSIESSVEESGAVSEVSAASKDESSAAQSSSAQSSAAQSSAAQSSSAQSSSAQSSSSSFKIAKNIKEYMEMDGVKDAIEKSMGSALGDDDKGSAKVSVKGTNTVFIEYTYSDDYTEEQIAAMKKALETRKDTLGKSMTSYANQMQGYIEEEGVAFEMCLYAKDGTVLFDETFTAGDND